MKKALRVRRQVWPSADKPQSGRDNEREGESVSRGSKFVGRQYPNLAADKARVLGQLLQGSSRGLKQQVIHHPLVMAGHGS